MFRKKFDTFGQWLYIVISVIEQVRMAGAVAWPEQGPEKQGLCSFEEGDAGENVLFLIKHFIINTYS